MPTKEAPYTILDKLPRQAREIYEETFSIAYDETEPADNLQGELLRERTAHRIAWAAVKKEYERGENGKWHKRNR